MEGNEQSSPKLDWENCIVLLPIQVITNGIVKNEIEIMAKGKLGILHPWGV